MRREMLDRQRWFPTHRSRPPPRRHPSRHVQPHIRHARFARHPRHKPRDFGESARPGVRWIALSWVSPPRLVRGSALPIHGLRKRPGAKTKGTKFASTSHVQTTGALRATSSSEIRIPAGTTSFQTSALGEPLRTSTSTASLSGEMLKDIEVLVWRCSSESGQRQKVAPCEHHPITLRATSKHGSIRGTTQRSHKQRRATHLSRNRSSRSFACDFCKVCPRTPLSTRTSHYPDTALLAWGIVLVLVTEKASAQAGKNNALKNCFSPPCRSSLRRNVHRITQEIHGSLAAAIN